MNLRSIFVYWKRTFTNLGVWINDLRVSHDLNHCFHKAVQLGEVKGLYDVQYMWIEQQQHSNSNNHKCSPIQQISSYWYSLGFILQRSFFQWYRKLIHNLVHMMLEKLTFSSIGNEPPYSGYKLENPCLYIGSGYGTIIQCIICWKVYCLHRKWAPYPWYNVVRFPISAIIENWLLIHYMYLMV